MKIHNNAFLRIAALATAVSSSTAITQAADVTLTAGTYADTQTYNNGTISGVVTFNSGANYTFDSLNLPLAWNRITLNNGAALNVAGNLSADVSGVSLNGGTLTTGGLLLHDSPNWNGSYNDGKQTIEYGDSIINGATVVANQSNANFISLAGGTGATNGWVANNLWLGNDGVTIDSGIHTIGITMVLGDFSGQSGKLTKTGSGTLTLTQANTYTGNTLISNGKIVLGNALALQNSAFDTASVNGGLDLNGNTSLTLGGLTGSVDLSSTLITGYGSVSELALQPQTGITKTYSGIISNGSGAMTLTKSGAGTQVLSGNNTYTGVTILEGGILNAASFADNGTDSSLGAGTGDTVAENIGLLFRGGTLQYTGSTAQSTNREIRLSTTGGGGTIDASGSNPSATLSFTATSSTNFFENPGNRTLTLTGSNTGDNAFAMAIGEAGGTTSLVKSGAGKWVITGANSYTGGTSLNEGTLQIENTSALGGGGLSMASGTTLQLRSDSDATFAGGNGLGGLGNASVTIDVNQLTSGNSNKTLSFATGGFDTYNTNINATGGNGYTLAIGAINNGYNGSLALNADTANLTIGNIGSSSAVSSFSVSGNANTTITGAINSSGGMAKSGGGTLTLEGTSTYSGATTVSAGTLLVSGALGNTAVSVDGGAFGGTGTVGGTLSITSGLFHVADLSDALAVSGTVTLFSGFGVDDLAGLVWGSVADGTYTLIDGTLGDGVFAGLANNSFATAFGIGGGRSAYFQSGSLQLVVIPEPRAALLGGLGMLALLRRRR